VTDDQAQEYPVNADQAREWSMSRLRNAILGRRENQRRVNDWRDIDVRNNFGPSIAAAMRSGRATR
jgi:hypothetical protein